ncbi:MAG: DUF1631 family protein [Ramlibacter sp.]
MTVSIQASAGKSFNEYVDLAVGESAALATRAVAAAVNSLAEAAGTATDRASRARLAVAAAELRRGGQPAADALPALLREEIEAAASAVAQSPKAFSFESLELMAEDQVDDKVELVRGQQIVMAAVEADLVAFSALVSAARGYANVSASDNPLRPEVWVRAFHRALGRGDGDRAAWMHHMSHTFGAELAALYRRLSELMTVQGISAAAYRITPQDEAQRRARGDTTGPTLRDLKRLLASVTRGESGTHGLTRPAGQTMNGMTMPAAMEALQGMKQMDEVVRRMQDRWRKGVWQPEAATSGDGARTDEKYTPTQTLAREVARLMIANVAADKRLLPDVQDAVREIEPALMRLVLHDQRFFVDRQHPARQLLEEVTQRSLAWPQRNEPGFVEFLAPFSNAVQMLSQMPLEDEEPFHYALQMLRQSWDEAEERGRRQRASMARALTKADARNHAAGEFSARLAERPDIASAPGDVRRFLLGPWCQVMAAARLASGADSPDPGGYQAAVDDIVWSTHPQLAMEDRSRLERTAPVLMQTLHAGLSSIGYPEDQSGELLHGIAAAHAKVLGGAAPPQTRQPEPVDLAGARADFKGETAPWLSPAEIGSARMMQAGDDAPSADFQSTAREQAAAPEQPRVAGTLDEVLPGQYFEVQVRGAWKRWRTTWASPHGLMLMFVDANGRPESMTRQMLDKMIELGAMRLLPSGSVVDGALDAVAQTALENSTQMPQ